MLFRHLTSRELALIRRALVGDAAAVHAALLSGKDEIPLAENFIDAAHQDWVRNECRHQRVWLDERRGEVAGVMVMSVNEIFYLVVPPKWRRQGIASQLTRHAIAWARKRRWGGVTAKVREANAPIIAILTKEGFSRHPILEAAKPGWVVYAIGDVR